MDPGGTRLSEFLAESKRRAGDSPNLRHGSEDLIGQRPTNLRESPESTQESRNEKPSATREFSRSFPSRQSQIEEVPSRQGQIDEEVQTAEAVIYNNPSNWELPEVINYFEKQGVKAAGLTFCRENEATGKWVEFYFDLPNIEMLLENDFGIEGYRERAKLRYKVKYLFEDARIAKQLLGLAKDKDNTEAKNTPGSYSAPRPTRPQRSPQGDHHEAMNQTRRRKQFLGDRGVSMPSFPKVKDGKGAEAIPVQEWKAFVTAVRIWSSLESDMYAAVIDMIYTDPRLQIDEQSIAFFNNDEMDMDKTLGLHIYMNCPTAIQKFMTPRETYEFKRGHISGLKILAYIGKKINRKTDDRELTLMAQMSTREPIDNIVDLENEITEFQLLLDEMNHQGVEYPASVLFEKLHKTIAPLMEKTNSSLIRVLQLPVTEYKKANGVRDGYGFMELLRQISDCVTYDNEFASLRIRKPKAQVLVASVSEIDKNKNKGSHNAHVTRRSSNRRLDDKMAERFAGHIMHPPKGLPCVNERETGKCRLVDCKGTHNFKGWKDEECTNGSYVKFSVCPGFIPGKRTDGSFCKCKHSKRPKSQELFKWQADSKREMAQMWAICMEIDPDFEPEEDEEGEFDSSPSSPREEECMSAVVSEANVSYDGSYVPLAYEHITHVGEEATEREVSGTTISLNYEASSGDRPSEEDAYVPPTMEEIVAVVQIPDDAKILIDGGTFAPMWGTGVHHMLVNRKTIPRKAIQTASGVAYVEEMGDLRIGDYWLLNGYVNNYMSISLLCEGALQEFGWLFLGVGTHKVVMTPKGDFLAEKFGNLHFWPTKKFRYVDYEGDGQQHERTCLNPTPEEDHPVPAELAEQVEAALKRVRRSAKPRTRYASKPYEKMTSSVDTDDYDHLLAIACSLNPIHSTGDNWESDQWSDCDSDNASHTYEDVFEWNNLQDLAAYGDSGDDIDMAHVVIEVEPHGFPVMMALIEASEQAHIADDDMPDLIPDESDSEPEYMSDEDYKTSDEADEEFEMQNHDNLDADGCGNDGQNIGYDMVDTYSALEHLVYPTDEMIASIAESVVGAESSDERQRKYMEALPDGPENDPMREHYRMMYADTKTTDTGCTLVAGALTRASSFEKMYEKHCREGHVHPMPSEKGHVRCEACIKASIRDKKASANISTHEDKLVTLNLDTVVFGTPNCNGDRYLINGVVKGTGFGICKGQPNKDSSNTSKTVADMISFIESRTDPGNKTGYKIQRVHTDPGSEYRAAFKEEMERRKILFTIGEVDRHTDNAVIENRNQRVVNVSTAMFLKAVGENFELYSPMVGCEVAKWANHCINHTFITPMQKEQRQTAYQEQFNDRDATLFSTSGIQVEEWGTLCYLYIIKKKRTHKMSTKAVRCIWNGVNTENTHSTSAIPITRHEGTWRLGKPIHSHRVITMQGVFPLSMHIDTELPTPMQDADPTAEPDSDSEEEELETPSYTVDKIVAHNEVEEGEFEYKVRFEGYTAKDDLWYHQSMCDSFKTSVEEYWQRRSMSITAIVAAAATSVISVELDVMEEMRNTDVMPHEHSVVKLNSDDDDRIFKSTMWLEATTGNSVQRGIVSNQKESKPRIFVSLFDGTACGAQSIPRFALSSEDKYVGVEIDPKKRMIADRGNLKSETFPGISRLLGHDVMKITQEMIQELCKEGEIVCLLGGWPCRDSSWLRTRTGQDGRKPTEGERKGIFGTETGKYFAMKEVWKWIKESNKEAHYFLENVVFDDLKDQWELVCEDFGKPTIVNSKHHSYTHRRRAWWTSWRLPEDVFKHLPPLNPNNCLDEGRKFDFKNGMTTVTASWKGGDDPIHYTSVPIIIIDEKMEGNQSIRSHEAEKLHHLPPGYTSVPGLTEADRLSAIGDGWDLRISREMWEHFPKVKTNLIDSCYRKCGGKFKLEKPKCEVMMVNETSVGVTCQYHRNIAMFLGGEMANIVGGVEMSKKDVMQPENRADFEEAVEKELNEMRKRRFLQPGEDTKKYKNYKPIEDLTEAEKKRALTCRFVCTRKRVDIVNGKSTGSKQAQIKGAAKARLVAQDLKVFNKQDAKETYAKTPSLSGARLMIASCDTKNGNQLSSGDFDVAYLQSNNFTSGQLVLIVYRNPFTGELHYEWLIGVIYGMQSGAYEWKDTLSSRLTGEMGFYEVRNMESMYHNPGTHTSISCHVDDPLVLTKNAEEKVTFWEELSKIFDIKGYNTLTEESALDYLSIKISMSSNLDIRLDNQTKIEGYLAEQGLTDCNPTKQPILKSTLEEIYKNKQADVRQSEEERSLTGKYLGQAEWLSQTTHPTIALAVSILSSLKEYKGTLDALKQLFRYLKGKKDFALVKEANNSEGLIVHSDSDWGGLYKPSMGQELRSRTGVLITYNGMPITWKSFFQQCVSTNYTTNSEELMDVFATSSAEAEVHAAADAVKEGLHLKYVADELGIPVSDKIRVGVDAGAAIGFINNTGSPARLKHINLRESWVRQLRDQSKVEFIKVLGTENPADFFTKIQPYPAFKEAEDKMMKRL